MLLKPRRNIEGLSISALDLFASALGVFVLIAILLFPYYLKQPSQQAEVDGARAELSSMGEALEAVRLTARESAEARAEAAARLQQAQAALANAESLAANAGQSRDAAQRLADAAKVISPYPAAIQLRFLQTLTEVATEKNSTTILPLPIDLLTAFLQKKEKE